MSVSQLVYVSDASPLVLHSNRPIADELKNISTRSRLSNCRLKVTGILLYKAGRFLQVLEGESVAVNKLFAKIAADPRHIHVERLITLPSEQRWFEPWSMGVLNLDEQSEHDQKVFDDSIRDLHNADPTKLNSSRRGILALLRMFECHDSLCTIGR